jgi:hypothetical protein
MIDIEAIGYLTEELQQAEMEEPGNARSALYGIAHEKPECRGDGSVPQYAEMWE